MFYNKKDTSTPYILDDLHPDGFQLLLRLIYHSAFCNTSNALFHSKLSTFYYAENILYAYDAAVKLEMPVMKEELIAALFRKFRKHKDPLCLEEFWKLMELSIWLELHEITKKLLAYAKIHAEKVFEDKYFFLANVKTIKLVFDFVDVPEYKVFECVAKWCEIIKSWSITDVLVQDLLTCVDFRKLSAKQFYVIISKHENIMSIKDALDITMYLADPTACSLPAWCPSEERNFKAAYENDPDVKVPDLKIKEFQSICVELRNFKLADVFLADNGTTKKLHPAQKLILALGSSVFETKLRDSPQDIIIYTDATSEDLENMLRYLYGLPMEVRSKSWISTLKTFDIALKYGCSEMRSHIQMIFRSIPLTPSIFWTFMDQENVLRHRLINTKELLNKFGQLNIESILQHEMFFGASKHSLIEILKCNCLNMSEYNILVNIGKWLQINCTNLPSVSKELLKYIRFESLTAEEFSTFIKVYSTIFTQTDALDIFYYLFYKASDKILPDWCYNGPLRGLFFMKTTKIGTIKVMKNGNAFLGNTSYRASYTIKILNQEKECKVQYLELAWIMKIKKKQKLQSQKCNIEISLHPKNKKFRFLNIDVPQRQRVMVPVFFRVTAQIPEVRLDISITMNVCRRLTFPDQNKFSFPNMEIKADTDVHCLNDAIVDDSTSEKVNVPKHLLTQYPSIVISTEKWCR